MACLFGRTELVKALLEKGADPQRLNTAGETASRMAPLSLRIKMEAFVQSGSFSLV